LNAGPVTFAPPQPAGWSQLVAVRKGAATLRRAGAWALVVPSTAVWIPAGAGYAIELSERCELRIAYVAEGFVSERACGSVAMPALLSEIVERAVESGYLDPSRTRDARLIAVARDELLALRPAAACFSLPMPRERALLEAVELALRVPEEAPSVAALASAAALSIRTFERRFARDTGLTPRAWLRLFRLGTATRRLATGAPVTEVAFAAGYASLSAFVYAYKSTYGFTPGKASALMSP
jgi:AraC-like DNA-binding protein